ncbi:MAG: ATP-binding protein [Planctomycetota bacterium]
MPARRFDKIVKELVVISGKGGTGKTSIVACIGALAESKVLADCDVDAADLHLLLAPEVRHRESFSGGKEASIRREDCVACGACLAHCRYEAIRREGGGAGDAVFAVDPFACEGCGVCVRSCPVKAIDFRPRASGEWFISETRHGPMVHARLGIAQENSGKLVTVVRKEAARIARERRLGLVIIDGPPGIGCPVIASICGTSLVLAVTEPTVSGLHDLERVVDLAAHFKVPVLVCINKCDLNEEMSARIRNRMAERGLRIAGKVPYDAVVTQAQIAGQSVVEFSRNGVAREIKRLWASVQEALEAPPHG